MVMSPEKLCPVHRSLIAMSGREGKWPCLAFETWDSTIKYDAFGNRVAKTVNGVTTQYLVDDLNPTGYRRVATVLTTFPNDSEGAPGPSLLGTGDG
jgi:hypothetical protein